MSTRLELLTKRVNEELKKIGARAHNDRFDVNFVDAVKYVIMFGDAVETQKKNPYFSMSDIEYADTTTLAARLIAYAVVRFSEIGGVGDKDYPEYPYDMTISITPQMERPL